MFVSRYRNAYSKRGQPWEAHLCSENSTGNSPDDCLSFPSCFLLDIVSNWFDSVTSFMLFDIFAWKSHPKRHPSLLRFFRPGPPAVCFNSFLSSFLVYVWAPNLMVIYYLSSIICLSVCTNYHPSNLSIICLIYDSIKLSIYPQSSLAVS